VLEKEREDPLHAEGERERESQPRSCAKNSSRLDRSIQRHTCMHAHTGPGLICPRHSPKAYAEKGAWRPQIKKFEREPRDTMKFGIELVALSFDVQRRINDMQGLAVANWMYLSIARSIERLRRVKETHSGELR